MIRVAFAGAHSTGKTTLLRDVMERCPSVHAIENISRDVITRGFPLGEYSTEESFVNYVGDQLRAERTGMLSGAALLISNRTTVDAVGYAVVNATLPRPHVRDYFIDMLSEIARLEASRYELFVEFPVSFPIVPDGVRPTDEKYRERVGASIHRVLEDFALPVITVAGSTDERFEQLMAALRHRGLEC